MFTGGAQKIHVCTCIHYNIIYTYHLLIYSTYTVECMLLPCSPAHNNSQTTYEVQYRGVDTPNDVNETFYSTITVSAGMELSYNILGLLAYSAYNVSVRATNQYGVGDFSEEVTVRTEEGGEC